MFGWLSLFMVVQVSLNTESEDINNQLWEQLSKATNKKIIKTGHLLLLQQLKSDTLFIYNHSSNYSDMPSYIWGNNGLYLSNNSYVSYSLPFLWIRTLAKENVTKFNEIMDLLNNEYKVSVDNMDISDIINGIKQNGFFNYNPSSDINNNRNLLSKFYEDCICLITFISFFGDKIKLTDIITSINNRINLSSASNTINELINEVVHYINFKDKTLKLNEEKEPTNSVESRTDILKEKEEIENRNDLKLKTAKDPVKIETTSSSKTEKIRKKTVIKEQNTKTEIKNVYLFFDTETTGIPKDYNAPISDSDNWPRLVQLSWILTKDDNVIISHKNYIIKPNGFNIPLEASNLHGITTFKAINEGVDLKVAISSFLDDLSKATIIVGHNIEFDINIVGAELYRLNIKNPLPTMKFICTMKESTDYCAIPGKYNYKWPKLDQLYKKLFNKSFNNQHNAASDISATMKCFFELKKRNIITEKTISNNHKQKSHNRVRKSIFDEEEKSLVSLKDAFKALTLDPLVSNLRRNVDYFNEYNEEHFKTDVLEFLTERKFVTHNKDGDRIISNKIVFVSFSKDYYNKFGHHITKEWFEKNYESAYCTLAEGRDDWLLIY